MSTRFLFTYWEPIPEMDLVNERILVSLWRETWTKAGFTPICLNESYAAKHPIYREFDAAVSKLPSSNPAGYERCCWLRWLAVQVAAKDYPNKSKRIVLCDYDVLPYGHLEPLSRLADAPARYWKESHRQMLSLHGNCPALVVGTADQFAEVAHYFVDYVPPAGLTHQSDQYLFEQFIGLNPSKFKVSMDVKLFSEPGWETANAVHFSNSVCSPNYLPKWKHIPILRPL